MVVAGTEKKHLTAYMVNSKLPLLFDSYGWVWRPSYVVMSGVIVSSYNYILLAI